jgi:hypothetical protein
MPETIPIDEATGEPISQVPGLRYDPFDQKWSFYHKGRHYLWEGDPFDLCEAERTARSITARS